MVNRAKAAILAAACATLVMTGSKSRAQDVTIPIAEAPAIIAGLVQQNQPSAAREIALGYLQARPDDTNVQLWLAQAELMLNRPGPAGQAARGAYFGADDAATRYNAAYLAAEAYAQEAAFTRSQIWLRLARQSAPNDQAQARIAQAYQQVTQLNPWATQIGLSIQPSDNINNGSQSETAYLQDNVSEGFANLLASFGIYDPETGLRILGDNERPLSGFTANLNFGTRYRLRADQTSATFLSLNASLTRNWLSDEAKEASPTSENSDFNRESLSFGISHRQILIEGGLPSSFSLTAGRSWYGGDPNTSYVTASVSQPFNLGPRDRLTPSLSISRSIQESSDTPTNSISAGLSWLHLLESGDIVRVSGSLRRSTSDLPDNDYTGRSIGVLYSFGEPIFDAVGMSVSLNVEQLDIGETLYAPFDRTDTITSAEARFSFTQAELFGFVPVVKVSAERNASTVDQFDREGWGVGLEFQSSF